METAMLLSYAALILSAPVLLAADDVPRLNYESNCRAAQPLSAEDKTPYQNCVNDETRARSQLERQWGEFPAAAKGRCTQESTLGGSPSYVELLTCLQLAKETNFDAGAPAIEQTPVRRS
jgi:hypothetical protein